MKGKFAKTYKKAGKDGIVRPRFVYLLSGSPEDLAKYKESLESKGINYHEDEETGKPLFFSLNYTGDNVDIIFTQDGRAIIDDSKLTTMSSLAEQAGGLVGQAIANQAAAMLLGQALAPVAAPVAQAPAAPVVEAEEEEADL